ncbi:hypothetical protein [Streptomyces sp. NPDC005573]|uniref:hypothetical protein n=1 Tax=Streptomyces sp. NPDC005573 TaxID=3156890 RepID=UPI0033B58ABB
MPTAVAVTSADLALPAQDERTMPAIVLRDLDRRPLDHALTEVHALIEQFGHLVVLCSHATPEPVVRRLHTLRSLLESDRIALFRPALPPLGIAVLARQLRQLASCELSPGVLASAGRLLTHYIHAGAVLGSVARLDRVPVGLKAHARSWVPGSQFAVLAHPEPQLVKIAPGATLKGPEFGTWMLVAKGQLQTDWVTGLAKTWAVQGLREAPLPAESAQWWGTGRVVEFCSYLGDLSVLYQLVTSVRQSSCHWCGFDVIGDRCVFCSAVPPEYGPPAPHAPGRAASGRQGGAGRRRSAGEAGGAGGPDGGAGARRDALEPPRRLTGTEPRRALEPRTPA